MSVNCKNVSWNQQLVMKLENCKFQLCESTTLSVIQVILFMFYSLSRLKSFLSLSQINEKTLSSTLQRKLTMDEDLNIFIIQI
jgi:hypothetical protein